jgi:hypothetical protein
LFTSQLAILDGLKNPHAASLISNIRSVVDEARKPKICGILKRETKLTAVLDQDTR